MNSPKKTNSKNIIPLKKLGQNSLPKFDFIFTFKKRNIDISSARCIFQSNQPPIPIVKPPPIPIQSRPVIPVAKAPPVPVQTRHCKHFIVPIPSFPATQNLPATAVVPNASRPGYGHAAALRQPVQSAY
jgi:hypothetical protein